MVPIHPAILPATVVLFFFGASIGSFVNVVAHRLPAGLSIVRPRSRCPFCRTTIPWHDNLPVASWFLLRGRCRFCGIPISARYPLVEATAGVLAVALVWRFGPTSTEVAAGRLTGLAVAGIYFAFAAALLTIALVDLDHQIVPDAISLPGIALGLLASAVLPVRFGDAALGVLAGGAALYLVAKGYSLLTRREGMGMGDVKLLAMIGAFLGWQALPFVLVVSSLTGSVYGLFLVRFAGKGFRHAFAFGPFLCLAAGVYLFLGETAYRWYLGGG